MAAAGIYALVRARAQWLFEADTAASIPAAVRLVPYDSAYLSRLAAWVPRDKVALLKRAVQLNPFDFQSWLQLGYVREFQDGDPKAAEQLYLRAADVNHMFLPRWTLTNFYFRHGQTAGFFHWANLTLAVTPYAPEPIFTQMWQMSQDPARIARDVPDRPRVLLPYAWFLSNNGRNNAIAPVVQRLVADVGKANPRAWGRDDLLAAIMDRLVVAGDGETALRVWTSMVRAHWIAETVPSADAPLTNGSFRSALYTHGFGWMPAHAEGAYVDQMFSPSGLRVQLTGDQAEDCVLLRQYLPVSGARTYRLRWGAEKQALVAPSGLAWHLHAVNSDGVASAVSPDIGGAVQSWQVHFPVREGLTLLTLEYHRPLGYPRSRGALLLRWVDMQAVSDSSADSLQIGGKR